LAGQLRNAGQHHRRHLDACDQISVEDGIGLLHCNESP
jgi:hypothetical protein